MARRSAVGACLHSARVARYYPLRGFTSAVVFLLSVPIAYIHSRLAQGAWLSIAVAFFFISRRFPDSD